MRATPQPLSKQPFRPVPPSALAVGESLTPTSGLRADRVSAASPQSGLLCGGFSTGSVSADTAFVRLDFVVGSVAAWGVRFFLVVIGVLLNFR